LRNYCILLVDLFESYDDARTCERLIRYECCVSIIKSFPILSVDFQGAVCVTIIHSPALWRFVHHCLRSSHNAGQQCPCLSMTVYLLHRGTFFSCFHIRSCCHQMVFISVQERPRRCGTIRRLHIRVKNDGVICRVTRKTGSKYFVVFSR
jgi:hypothetical protein